MGSFQSKKIRRAPSPAGYTTDELILTLNGSMIGVLKPVAMADSEVQHRARHVLRGAQRNSGLPRSDGERQRAAVQA